MKTKPKNTCNKTVKIRKEDPYDSLPVNLPRTKKKLEKWKRIFFSYVFEFEFISEKLQAAAEEQQNEKKNIKKINALLGFPTKVNKQKLIRIE